LKTLWKSYSFSSPDLPLFFLVLKSFEILNSVQLVVRIAHIIISFEDHRKASKIS